MRLTPLITATLSLLMAGPSFAQEWIEYASRADFFTVNFPGEPKVQDITYDTEYWITLPGRVYSYQDGASRYSVTVIDYSNTAKLQAEHAKKCKESGGYPDQCLDHTQWDLHAAVPYATWKLFLQRDAKLTDFGFITTEMIGGHRLQLTNSDGSRSYAVIHMHDSRLYILEGTVPKGAPEPALFQQSLGFIDAEGRSVRYQSIYTFGYPAPPRARYQNR
jgi:hypothetical protein